MYNRDSLTSGYGRDMAGLQTVYYHYVRPYGQLYILKSHISVDFKFFHMTQVQVCGCTQDEQHFI